MSPYLRYGMLFIGGCVVVGGALAGAAHNADGSPGSLFGRGDGPSQRIVLSETIFSHRPPTPTPTAASTANPSDQQEPEAEPIVVPEPAPRVKPGSVFRAEGQGSLACRIPGGSDFLVEWDAAKAAAVAHFSGVKIPGALIRERASASNTIDNRVAISREEAGHSFSMTIDDGGTMSASVDGRDSTGTCNPV